MAKHEYCKSYPTCVNMYLTQRVGVLIKIQTLHSSKTRSVFSTFTHNESQYNISKFQSLFIHFEAKVFLITVYLNPYILTFPTIQFNYHNMNKSLSPSNIHNRIKIHVSTLYDGLIVWMITHVFHCFCYMYNYGLTQLLPL